MGPAAWLDKKPLAAADNTAVRPYAETPQAATVAQTALETVAPKPPVAPALDPEQVQQIAQSLAALRQTAEQLVVGQDQIAREITKLLAADVEILLKVPTAPPQPSAASARKLMPLPLPSSRTTIPPR